MYSVTKYKKIVGLLQQKSSWAKTPQMNVIHWCFKHKMLLHTIKAKSGRYKSLLTATTVFLLGSFLIIALCGAALCKNHKKFFRCLRCITPKRVTSGRARLPLMLLVFLTVAFFFINRTEDIF